MKTGKQMKRGVHEYQFTDKLACCKWFDQRSVTMLFSKKKRFYLFIFFDLMDVPWFNAFMVYNMMNQNDLALLNYKKIA